jgi:RNA polymerase sigma-70 factor (ECF subfamily)
MRERSDEALMAAYADGDMNAFEQLYQRHRGPLYRYIRRQVGDAPTANDLYQGCWEKIIRARVAYRATAPFQAWMYRIAHNHIIDQFRRRRPTAEVSPDALQADDPGPDQVLAGAQAAARLAAAVRALPTEQRQAVLLRLEAGLGLPAIAAAAGVNQETAKSRLRYAVAKLKRALTVAQDEPGA